jgi:AcrR family transcriptional regulator
MSKRQARFEQLRESSKERIERAAMELFAHQGYGNTSISQIAQAAGISKGLMYNYYESKEALLKAIVKKGFDIGNEMTAKGAEMLQNEAPQAILKALINRAFDEVLRTPEYWKLLTSLAFQEEVLKAIAPEMEEQKQKNIRLGVHLFQQMGYPKPLEQALLLGAALDGVLLQYIIYPDEYPLENMKQLLIETFCPKI